MGDTVVLDAGGSSTPNGDGSLSYTWSLIAQPEFSKAELEGSDTIATRFVADLPGRYVANLTVDDGTRQSQPSRVTITATNPYPVAVVRPIYNELLGAQVTLDGTRSVPPSGADSAELSFRWTLTERPEESNATLFDATTATPWLEADAVGTYSAELVVSHAGQSSEPAVVTVTVTPLNTVPVADAGGDRSVPFGRVHLDGSGSYDADGDPLSYRWRFAKAVHQPAVRYKNIPIGSQTELADADTATPYFDPDLPGDYEVTLYVFDGTSRSAVSRATITVEAPERDENTPPVAVLQYDGPDNAEPYEVEPGVGWQAYVYPASGSYDVDGDPLAHHWEWISYPNGFDPDGPHVNLRRDNPGHRSAYFTPTEQGEYVLQLTVNDGSVDSEPAQIVFNARLGANRPPVAVADADSITALVGSSVGLDGTGSYDPNDDPLSYHWRLIDRPDHSQASLSDPDSARPSFVPDEPGAYIAELTVRDHHGLVSYPPDEVTVMAKTHNTPPVVNPAMSRGLSTEQPFTLGQPFGAQSFGVRANAYDVDGDPLYYLFVLAQQPAGSNLPEASDGNGRVFWNLTPEVPGTYVFEVAVSDGIDTTSGVVKVGVVEREDYPGLLLENAHCAVGSYRQQTFPFSRYPTFSAEDRCHSLYRLTAVDRDYTIVNLHTASDHFGYVPWFDGLEDGQVIAQGEEVVFSVWTPAVPEHEPVSAMSLGFSVAEKPGWDFQYRVRPPLD
nr:PKD domain-containing protein [Alkalilimnicola ehrlichii]